jgi:hypothetical protein
MDADRQAPAGDWLQGAAVLSFDVDAEAPILAEGDQCAEDLSTIGSSHLLALETYTRIAAYD